MGIVYSLINDLIVLRGLFKIQGVKKTIYLFLNYLNLYLKFSKNINYYKKKNIKDHILFNKKKTKKVFIIGSGYSLNSISKKKWDIIKKNDAIGFNNSFYLKKTPITYHITRAGNEEANFHNTLKDWIKFFQDKVKTNKFYKKTIFLFPQGITANFTNTLLGERLYNIKNSFYLFRTNRISKLPAKKISNGLIHRSGTLFDAISLAYYLGYKKIVLLGVDLYDVRYFFAPKNKTITWDIKKKRNVFVYTNEKNRSYVEKHFTVNKKFYKEMKNLNFFLNQQNIKLYIENKKSLLSKIIKIYKW